MLVTIAHAKDDYFRDTTCFPEHVVSAGWDCGVTHEAVAEYTINPDSLSQGEILEGAFRCTNSIDSYWGDSDYLTMLVHHGCRSTSVGDLIILEGAGAFVVMSCGFKAKEKDPVEPIRDAELAISEALAYCTDEVKDALNLLVNLAVAKVSE